jgi:PAP2 superfamily
MLKEIATRFLQTWLPSLTLIYRLNLAEEAVRVNENICKTYGSKVKHFRNYASIPTDCALGLLGQEKVTEQGMIMLQPVEWFTLSYFAFFICYAWFWKVANGQRIKITLLGFIGILIILIVAAIDHSSRKIIPVIRNFSPALLMLIAYWQSGCFYTQPNLKLQNKLVEFDKKVAVFIGKLHLSGAALRWIHHYLESAYLFCYPMVPLGIVILYFLKMGSQVPTFWKVVIPPSFVCYATVAFVQTLPPRTLEAEILLKRGGVQTVNMGIIQRASIQINTFPSAHAAASMAVALAIIQVAPLIGSVLFWLALSISAAAAVCRYHFTADVIVGTLIAIVWFVLLRFFH